MGVLVGLVLVGLTVWTLWRVRQRRARQAVLSAADAFRAALERARADLSLVAATARSLFQHPDDRAEADRLEEEGDALVDLGLKGIRTALVKAMDDPAQGQLDLDARTEVDEIDARVATLAERIGDVDQARVLHTEAAQAAEETLDRVLPLVRQRTEEGYDFDVAHRIAEARDRLQEAHRLADQGEWVRAAPRSRQAAETLATVEADLDTLPDRADRAVTEAGNVEAALERVLDEVLPRVAARDRTEQAALDAVPVRAELVRRELGYVRSSADPAVADYETADNALRRARTELHDLTLTLERMSGGT